MLRLIIIITIMNENKQVDEEEFLMKTQEIDGNSFPSLRSQT